jgi:hypothetical protein
VRTASQLAIAPVFEVELNTLPEIIGNEGFVPTFDNEAIPFKFASVDSIPMNIVYLGRADGATCCARGEAFRCGLFPPD